MGLIPIGHATIQPDYPPDYFGMYLEYATTGDESGNRFAYEINGWAEGMTSIVNITEIEDTNAPLSTTFAFVSLPNWSIVTSLGNDSGQNFYPPLWQNISAWSDSESIALVAGGGTYTLTENWSQQTPAGTFNCWHLSCSYSDSDHSTHTELYYESATGILVKVYSYTIVFYEWQTFRSGYHLTRISYPWQNTALWDSSVNLLLMFGIILETVVLVALMVRIRSRNIV